MVATYSLNFVNAFVNSQVKVLSQMLQWVELLETSYTELQQTVTQKTHELQQQQRQLAEMRLESRRIRKHMIQMEKLATLGQMISGISHEINNPINFIYGNIPYVEEHVQDLLTVLQIYQENCSAELPAIQTVLEEIDLEFVLEDLPRIVDSMKLGADRIRELVLTLRNFYRLDEAEMKPANLIEGIEDTLLLLQHRYKQGIEIIKEFDDLPDVECHINQINQVFMNLLSNAIDALVQQEEEDELCDRAIAPKQIRIATKSLNNNWISISIYDTGAGISSDAQDRLFDPFFTTKPIGVGTGLGLSISRQIITETHHGQIHCRSTPGRGTTFTVELPIQQPIDEVQPEENL
jgi:signal transduction histidine kinase